MHRQFTLKSSAVVDQIILYVITVMAKRHGIKLHALTVMYNHIHDVVTDPDAKIIDFYRDSHSNIAKAINCHFGREGSLWNTNKPNRLDCVTRDAVLDKIAYAMANPVAAFLVQKGYQWPGIRMAWPAKPKTIKRPNFYFRSPDKGGNWPDEVVLQLERPPDFTELGDEELAGRIEQETLVREEAARSKAKRRGILFLGRRALKRVSRYSYPKNTVQWFQVVPVVAGKDVDARKARILENQLWYRDYQSALARFVAGERDVVFPYGTYKLPRHYGVQVEAIPV